MARWVNSIVLDYGLYAVKGISALSGTDANLKGANKMILLKAYTAGDTYTAVNTTNNVAEVAMAIADFTLGAGVASNSRMLTTATKSSVAVTGAANTATGADFHIAFVDTTANGNTGRVLWVTDETTASLSITTSDTVNFPAITLQLNQPTA